MKAVAELNNVESQCKTENCDQYPRDAFTRQSLIGRFDVSNFHCMTKCKMLRTASPRTVKDRYSARAHREVWTEMLDNFYGVPQQVSDFCWVDLDLDVPLILANCCAHSAYLSSAQADLGREWNIQNQSQPNPSQKPSGTPCRNCPSSLFKIPCVRACVVRCLSASHYLHLRLGKTQTTTKSRNEP